MQICVVSQIDQRALGTPADHACDMRKRCSATAAREYEFAQRRQVIVELLDQVVDPGDVGFGYQRMTGQTQFSAKVEQVVLHADQRVANGVWQCFSQQQADVAVQLIDVAQRGNPRLVLGDAFSGCQAGAAVIAGAGDYPGKSVGHLNILEGGEL
jgi:hypothetical protein